MLQVAFHLYHDDHSSNQQVREVLEFPWKTSRGYAEKGATFSLKSIWRRKPAELPCKSGLELLFASALLPSSPLSLSLPPKNLQVGYTAPGSLHPVKASMQAELQGAFLEVIYCGAYFVMGNQSVFQMSFKTLPKGGHG